VIDANHWLRLGVDHSLQVIVFEPLFEEANRTRRLLAEIGRGLDIQRIGLTIASLSGMGESLTPISQVTFAQWRDEATAAIAQVQPTIIASLRGGALIDDIGAAKGWWRFAPETGARIVRDLKRTQLAGETGLYAGHALSDDFLGELEAAQPVGVSPLRTVRLESDAAAADAKLPGSPLWRRAEPGEDAVLAAAMTSDLAAWVMQCAVS
jgi:hypothetical protein